MKFISVRELRLKPGRVWDQLKDDEEIVITANGKPIALLTGIDEGALTEEVDALRRARALIALDRIQRDSVRQGTDSWRHSFVRTDLRPAS